MSAAAVASLLSDQCEVFDILVGRMGRDITLHIVTTEGGHSVLAFEFEAASATPDALAAALELRSRFETFPMFQERAFEHAVSLGTYHNARRPAAAGMAR